MTRGFEVLHKKLQVYSEYGLPPEGPVRTYKVAVWAVKWQIEQNKKTGEAINWVAVLVEMLDSIKDLRIRSIVPIARPVISVVKN